MEKQKYVEIKALVVLRTQKGKFKVGDTLKVTQKDADVLVKNNRAKIIAKG